MRNCILSYFMAIVFPFALNCELVPLCEQTKFLKTQEYRQSSPSQKVARLCNVVGERHTLLAFELASQMLKASPNLETYYYKSLPLFHRGTHLLAIEIASASNEKEVLASLPVAYAAKLQEIMESRFSLEEMQAYYKEHEVDLLKVNLCARKFLDQLERHLYQIANESEGYLTQVNQAVWEKIEGHLTPLPRGSDDAAFWHYAPLAGLFPVGFCTLSADLICRGIYYGFSWFSPWYWCEWVDGEPEEDFLCLLKDARNWEKLSDLSEKITIGQNNPDFQWGVATCTFQDSPIECEHSQWRRWDRQNGNCIEKNKERFEKASLMRLYQTVEGRKELTDRLHKLGLNAYRFSIAWSEIEPEEGFFDEELILVLVELCVHLRNERIAPMVTLHHFSEPDWFHNKGSFEKEENIVYFKRLVEKVGPYLIQNYKGKPLVGHICTINEPNIEAFSRYVRGAFSPGVILDFERGGHFMKNALKAHQEAYHVLKKMNSAVQVGIVHQRLDFHPTNLLISPVTRYLSRFVNETVLSAFKTGQFELKIPFICPYLLPGCHIQEKEMHLEADFLGLQYYVRPLIGMTGSSSYYAPMTHMPFREDPEGLYEAIIEAYAACQIPIIVTENGISTKDPSQRNRYNQRALYALQRAQEQIGKENLLGYYYWCITNNFEWDMGLDQFFGAYDVDDKGNISEDPKPGMDTFTKVTHVW